MATLSDYVSGTITLTNGSAAFLGTGTSWQSAGFREGDTVIDVEGATAYTAVILSIDGEGAGTLTRPWAGPTRTNAAYRMRYVADGQRVTAQARTLIELLGNGNLQAFAALEGSVNKFPVFIGPGALTLADISALGGGAGGWDITIASLDDLDEYDDEPEGYRVMVIDNGEDPPRSAVYEKNSNSTADWSDPIYFTGSKGTDGREVELRVEAGVLEWRYEGGAWDALFTFELASMADVELDDPEEGDGLVFDGSDWINARVVRSPTLKHAIELTQEEYEALDPPDDNTLYLITPSDD